MLISGFTMARNAEKLYFPIIPSIKSALPLVDEFIVALGDSDADDQTRQLIEQIQDKKIKIFDRFWDPSLYKDGQIFAHETSFALQQCQGTWCLYLQADEVLHEDDLSRLRKYCEQYRDDLRVEGFLFNYYHFWGDYDHHLVSHSIIKKEIRIVRNHIGVYSYKDAISFRKPMDQKLRVIQIPCHIYHYGHVRPPDLMGIKKKVQNSIHEGKDQLPAILKNFSASTYDYGPLGNLQPFSKSHPEAMKSFIHNFYWKNQLNYRKLTFPNSSIHKHLRLKNRLMTQLENIFNGGNSLFGWKNYKLLNRLQNPKKRLKP
ncbi:MAG: glycosyltransferase family protein [Chitinophagaceae bacterium]